MTSIDRPCGDRRGALTTNERGRLTALEGVVERGIQTYIEVGLALQEIRDQRLYRETHDTFEGYITERWSRSRQWGCQQIESAQVAAALSTVVDIPTARQAREVASQFRRVETADEAVEWLADKYGVRIAAPMLLELGAKFIRREMRRTTHRPQPRGRRSSEREIRMASGGCTRLQHLHECLVEARELLRDIHPRDRALFADAADVLRAVVADLEREVDVVAGCLPGDNSLDASRDERQVRVVRSLVRRYARRIIASPTWSVR